MSLEQQGSPGQSKVRYHDMIIAYIYTPLFVKECIQTIEYSYNIKLRKSFDYVT